MAPLPAPFGTWTSPISAQTVAAAAVRLGSVSVDGDDIYWLEGRPEEQGRGVIVRRTADGRVAEVTRPGSNVRTRVQEYGGAAYLAARGTVHYVEFSDQRVYAMRPGGAAHALTPAGRWQYADFAADPLRPRLVCVREDHTADNREAITTLVALALDGSSASGKVLVEGHDFYSTPRFSPDGSQLAWLAWRHPNMPWDGTELWLADVAGDGSIAGSRLIAGSGTESIFQPGWSPDGTLYFVSDRTGWWNLYRAGAEPEIVYEVDAEFGRAQWQLGVSTWAAIDGDRLVVAYAQNGRWRLGVLDVARGVLSPFDEHIEPGDTIAATRTHAALVAGSGESPDAVVRIELATGSREMLRVSSAASIESGFLSKAEAIEFPTAGGRTAHAFYYAPANPGYEAQASERPPLIVVSHGGPTGAAHARLNLELQYWTSRGFAVVDVNYGGSTGYGRAYRQRLQTEWGVVDVADCVNAAHFLAARGQADPSRLIVRGRSAGGYTTLAALTFRPEVFKAGASYYGVADLELLARDTHKFESRYLDGLIGPYPRAERRYRSRSPIHYTDRLSCPLILFQGLEDRVVPPVQSRLMADAVRAKGLPMALLMFPGEQHGFRRAETVVRCLESELFFYGAVFGFTPAGPRPELTIENL